MGIIIVHDQREIGRLTIVKVVCSITILSQQGPPPDVFKGSIEPGLVYYIQRSAAFLGIYSKVADRQNKVAHGHIGSLLVFQSNGYYIGKTRVCHPIVTKHLLGLDIQGTNTGNVFFQFLRHLGA